MYKFRKHETTHALTHIVIHGVEMRNIDKLVDVKYLASAPATPEKIHVYKTGANAGKTRKLKAKPARQGLLPVSEKTIWEWSRDGRFPKPIRLGGAGGKVTVWRASDVQKWIEEQSA